MRKTLSIIALLFSTSFISNAQHFGVKLGVNSSNIAQKGQVSTFNNGQRIYQNYWNDTKQTIGLQAGIFANFGVKNVIIQPELLFSMKGFKNGSDTYQFSYIDLPVLVGYEFVPKFRVLVGPQFGYFITEKSPIIEAYRRNFEKIEIGAILSFAYQFTEKIGVNARYNYGITTVYGVPGYSDIKNMNRGIQVSLQYQIK